MATIEDKVKALQKSKAEEFASACPSRVIELALEDLEAVERSKKHEIVMDACHQPRRGKCLVCLGGAVMANRLGADPDEELLFDSYELGGWGKEESKRLSALDYFRQGLPQWALSCFKIDWPGEHFKVTRYETNRKQFKTDMRAMAEMLKQHGL